MAIVIDGKGNKTEAETPQSMIEARERVEETVAAGAATGSSSGRPPVINDDVLEYFKTKPQRIVVEREVEIGGTMYRIFVEKLSPRECHELDAKKYRINRANGIPVRDIATENIKGMAYAVSRCILRNAGTDEQPEYEPLLTLEDILGTEARGGKPAVRGLVDSADDEVAAFLWHLEGLVYEQNPSLNPLLQAAALGAPSGLQ